MCRIIYNRRNFSLCCITKIKKIITIKSESYTYNSRIRNVFELFEIVKKKLKIYIR